MRKQRTVKLIVILLTVFAAVAIACFAACTQPAAKKLSAISITAQPDKVAYIEGETFDKSGMTVTAEYDDESKKVVTSYTVAPDGVLNLTDTKITVSYTEGGITKTAEVSVTVSKKVQLTGIEVTEQPTQKVYAEGETFNPAGMVITATYDNGTTAEVTGYTVSPNGALALTDKKVTISYTDGAITKTADVEITVKKPLVLTGIEITSQPTKTQYVNGETFDSEGMEVTATYDDGTSEPVTEYTCEPDGVLAFEDTQITVYYTFGGVTKSAVVEIGVHVPEEEMVRENGTWLFEEDYADYTNFTRDFFVGASGKYYLGNAQSEGSTITYNIEAEKAIEGDLYLRIATGMGNRPEGIRAGDVYTVTVNGTPMQYGETELDGEIDWNRYYEYLYGRICLAKGFNEIVISYTGFCAHNFDYIKIKTGTDSRLAPVDGTLTSITLSGEFKTEYTEGESFDKTGLTVTANYDGAESREIPVYSLFPFVNLEKADEKILVSYTERGITVTAEISVTVTEPARDLKKDGEFIIENTRAVLENCSNNSEGGTDDGSAIGGMSVGSTAKFTFTLTAEEDTGGKLYLRAASGMDGLKDSGVTVANNYKVKVNGVEITSPEAPMHISGWTNYEYYLLGNIDIKAADENVIEIEYLGTCNFNIDNIKLVLGTAVAACDLQKDGEFIIENTRAVLENCSNNSEGGTDDGSAIGGMSVGSTAKFTFTLTAEEDTGGKLYLRAASGMDGLKDSGVTVANNYKVKVNGVEITSPEAPMHISGWTNYEYYLLGDIEIKGGVDNVIEIEFLGTCNFNIDNIKLVLGSAVEAEDEA